MRPRFLAAIGLLLLAAVTAASSSAALGQANRVHVRVSPRHGTPATTFVVRFRAPDAAGHSGVIARDYLLSVHRAGTQKRCVHDVEEALPAYQRGAHARVRLDPAKLGGRWCQGALRGRIEEETGPFCQAPGPCPEFATRIVTIGRFTLNVRRTTSKRRPTGGQGDTTPPTFAGVEHAFACTPGPQRPGQTTPFTLTWTAATDNVTPSSGIVYDVYKSTTAGGENFSAPSWTTPAGVTSFKTPGLASHGTFYFVVRARDAAGNEDRNTVEVRGVDPCL